MWLSSCACSENEDGTLLALDLSCDHNPRRPDELARVEACGAVVMTSEQVAHQPAPPLLLCCYSLLLSAPPLPTAAVLLFTVATHCYPLLLLLPTPLLLPAPLPTAAACTTHCSLPPRSLQQSLTHSLT